MMRNFPRQEREKNKKIKNAKILFNRELHEVHNAKKSNKILILICDNLCIQWTLTKVCKTIIL
jgi:hypothetical protein